MGQYRLDGWDAAIAKIQTKVYNGVRATANQVQADAVARAPVRKAFSNRHEPTKHDLADFSMKIGKDATYTGDDLRAAAALIGIDLNVSAAKRMAAGRKALQVQTGRSGGANRLTFRGGRERYITEGKTRYRRVTGTMLREVTPLRAIGGTLIGFGVNKARLKKQGVKLTPRARYDLAHARGAGSFASVRTHTTYRRGVMSSGGRSQYGGYLRKHILVDDPETTGARITIRVVSEAPYSRYVEFPTSRTAAQPYLLPAFKRARGILAENIKKG